jgi:hypothetical protein
MSMAIVWHSAVLYAAAGLLINTSMNALFTGAKVAWRTSQEQSFRP